MSFFQLFALAVGAILAENLVLVRVLGVCSFLEASNDIKTGAGMGIAVTFVMGLSSMATYLVNFFLLAPFQLQYLETVAYILVIVGMVHLAELFFRRYTPTLYSSLGIGFPLVTANCAILGTALLGTQNGYGFVASVVYGVCSGLGYTLAVILFAGIRRRLEFAEYPKSFEGAPIALVTAGLLALCFMGFAGLRFW